MRCSGARRGRSRRRSARAPSPARNAGKARLAFHLASNEIASTLTLAHPARGRSVVSASAFVAGNPEASPADFDRWAESVHAMRRYPELRNLGLVELVPAARLRGLRGAPRRRAGAPAGPRLRSRRAARCRSCRPAVARTTASRSPGWPAAPPATYPRAWTTARSRRRSSAARETGVATYAPVDGSRRPRSASRRRCTAAARRRHARGGAAPSVRRLAGRADRARRRARAGAGRATRAVAVRFRYSAAPTHAAFTSGAVPATRRARRSRSANGWTWRASPPASRAACFASSHALTLLIGGVLLSLMLGAAGGTCSRPGARAR